MSLLNTDDESISIIEITAEDERDYLQFEIEALQSAYDLLKEENKLNKDALALLIAKCKAGGFNPFADEGIALVSDPYKMPREQLFELNKKVSEKFIKSKATGSDLIPFPTSEEVEAKYADRKDKGYKEAVDSTVKRTVKYWIAEIQKDEKDNKKEQE